MPTTFSAISLGILADIDTTEGNNISENAAALVGMTFGGVGDSLVNDFVTISSVGNPGSFYDMDNSPNDRFSVDGGAAQTFDGTAIYNATITYIDGTTQTYTAVLFQDTAGNTYLAPEFSANADQTSLEAGAIRSITLDSLSGNDFAGMAASRESWNFVSCFVRGTKIETATGQVPVQELKTGDMIRTVDHGFQTLRWIGNRKVQAEGAFAPVKFCKGALGNTEDFWVSPQHRIFLSGWRAELHFGQPEVLIAAKNLINGDTILRDSGGDVDYYHIMFDQHELVYSAGIETESFHPGLMGWGTLPETSREEILTLFPELRSAGISAYGDTARPVIKAQEVRALFG